MGAKITDLPEVLAADVAPDDVTILSSIGEAESKKITIAELAQAVSTEIRVTALERVSGVDDFETNPALAWVVETENGGSAFQGDNAAAYGVPDSGVFGLNATTTASSRAYALRALTGLVRDTGKPIVVEWQRVSVLTAGAVSDDECAWLVGLVDGTGPSTGNGVFLFAALDPGREFNIVILTGGVIAATPVVLPALGAEDSYRIRLTVLPGSVVLEAAVNDEELVEIETVTAATPAVVYHPAFQIEKSTGAGDRLLLAGRVTWDGYRTVSAAAAGAPFLTAVEAFATKSDVEEVADDLTAHAGTGGAAHANAVAAGAAGFMTGTDKTKLDGIEAGADVTDAANVAAAGALMTAGAGLTSSGNTVDAVANADGSIVVNANDIQVGVLATDAQHGTRGGGTQHAEATASAAGFMPALDRDFQFDRRYSFSEFCEFMRTVALDTVLQAGSGTGAGNTAVVSAGGQLAKHPGRIRQSTGTTNTGYAYLFANIGSLAGSGQHYIGAGKIIFRAFVYVDTLSTVSEEYILRVGAGNLNSGGEPTNGVYFKYDRLTSTNWIARTAASSSYTTATGGTNVAVTTGWWLLEFEINAGGTSVDFYVTADGGSRTLIGSCASNLPANDGFYPGYMQTTKSAGTTARVIDVDYMAVRQEFTGGRI